MCNMAASLVDVRMGSSPVRDEDEGRAAKGLTDGEQSKKNNPTQSSPTPDGTGMERHGWDPGDEGTQETSTHFEPRIDLVMGTQLIKPKEEFVQFGTDGEDNMSFSNGIEPKMEYQDVSSAEEGETSCGIPLVSVPSGPSLSLVSLNEPPQTYRPHILGSPIVSALQSRPTPSSSSSHVYSHFLPPIGTAAHGMPSHAASSSPGAVAAMGSAAGDRRGGGDGSGGGGHLKWEMPRPCPVCRRIYSNNSNLRRHLRTIHEEYYEAHMQ
ncbi:uncharacterized protein [Hetaerina americana]|uniref:uncharacterized protein n=1 Tax=Hetaerina americana TaxID=62018 RepID=UPI003A7F27EA